MSAECATTAAINILAAIGVFTLIVIVGYLIAVLTIWIADLGD